jgi:hypothetical protein
MTHTNRGCLTVFLGGIWRHYTNAIPVNSRAIGTVTRDECDTGALVLIEATGRYVQINAGVSRSLDQRKVVAALAEVRTGRGGAGRGQGIKAADGATGLKRTNITIDQASADALRAFGDGDMSLGIRRAAAHIKNSSK